MIEISEIVDIQKRLSVILNKAKKDKANRRIVALVGGMLQATSALIRLLHLEERKKKKE